MTPISRRLTYANVMATSSTVFDETPTMSNGEWSIAINDSGTLSGGYDYGGSNAVYRCAFPMTNSS